MSPGDVYSHPPSPDVVPTPLTRREKRAQRAMARSARKKAERAKRAAGEELNAEVARARDRVDAAEAHVDAIVHRDVKPENVIVGCAHGGDTVSRIARYLDTEPARVVLLEKPLAEESLAEKIRARQAAKK